MSRKETGKATNVRSCKVAESNLRRGLVFVRASPNPSETYWWWWWWCWCWCCCWWLQSCIGQSDYDFFTQQVVSWIDRHMGEYFIHTDGLKLPWQTFAALS